MCMHAWKLPCLCACTYVCSYIYRKTINCCDITDLLKLPEACQPKMTTQRITMLPKHISGEEIIQFLEEKINKTLQEEEEKGNAKYVDCKQGIRAHYPNTDQELGFGSSL